MLALYCQMKARERIRNQEIINYYTEINRLTCARRSRDSRECRVCLQDASIHILEEKNKEEITEALQIFANISISTEDQYSKHLCRICFRFIQEAILFRKTAANSEEILKNTTLEQFSSVDSDSGDNICDNDDYFGSKSPQKLTDSTYDNRNEIVKDKDVKKPKSKSKVTCNICKKVMNSSYYYNHHLSIHDPNAEHKYVCDICGKSFRLNCAFHNHKMRHNPEFSYKCQSCPYRARYRDLLRNHMKTHTGEQKYMCTECPKRFLFRSNLNAHMFQHREPQFKCDSCKKAFHTKLKLEKHVQVDHLGIKNHVCNICGKAFGCRKDMMKHQLGVHKRAKLGHGRMPSYLQAERANHSL